MKGQVGMPSSVGLYNPAYEHDSCGVAMVVDMHGRRSRDIVDKAITALLNLEHRGAQGAEPNTGDGAGILLQVPDRFLRAVCNDQGFDLPEPGSYATGIAFLPQSAKDAAAACAAVEKIVEAEGLDLLGWRDVPTDESSLGALARDAMPTFRQLFVGGAAGMELERRAYVIRKRAEHELGTKGPGQDGPGRETVYFPSLSGETFVYKGMLTTPQLKAFYLDLQDDRLESALGIVHSRFSTNTFPSWPLAHPFRRIAHNGEINTVTGNENWMRAREALIHTDVFGYHNDLNKIFPVCTPGASDTARFDEVLELLHLGGRSIAHAVLMMIPEAWERNESMDPARRAFYQYHGSLMEPWDGPASVCFTDGTVVGAVLDRNGLRPSRIWVTDDGLVVMASEAGVLDLDPAKVVRRMRLQPGRMFLVDTAQGRIVDDEEIKAELAAEHPYGEWLEDGLFHLDELPQGDYVKMPHHRVVLRQQAFGFTYEELNLLVAPDGPHRRRGAGLDGHRHPDRRAVGAAADAVRLLPAVVRPGDQPAAGRHPRRSGDQPAGRHRPGRRPAQPRRELVPADRAAPADPAEHRTGQAGQRRPRSRGPRAQARHARGGDQLPVPGCRGRQGLAPRTGGRPEEGLAGDPQRRADHRALRPGVQRVDGAHPVAAVGGRGAPPPGPREHPHAGRPGGRGR